MLLLLAVQTLACISTTSATFDEPYHLGAGYAYLRTGDPRLNNHHPPLIDALLSVPLLLLNPQLPLESPAWQHGEYGSFGDVFVWQTNQEIALRLIWLGRLPNLALSLLLGAVLFRWIGRWLGRPAGTLTLMLYALDPGIVANAGLATNDLGVAATLLLAVWACWRWLRRPTFARLLLAGVLAGAASTSKFSGLAIGPVAALLTALDARLSRRSPAAVFKRFLGLTAIGLICVATIWAVYRFSVTDGMPARAFWDGLRFQSERIVSGQPTYAKGRIWPSGVWFYYPLAFLLKTPLPTLIFFAWGLIRAIKERALGTLSPLLLPALVFGGIVGLSALQLGHRLLLPVLPFVFAIGGYVARDLSRAGRIKRLLAGALMAWLTATALWISPHNLSFFNALSEGPKNADHYLVDANLDWGQDLPALRATMEEYAISRVHLGYFGSAIPDLYGISYWPAPGFLRFVGDAESMAFNPYTPEPGWYAISRTSLRQGLVLTHPDIYAYFRTQAPALRAGYSINLYHVMDDGRDPSTERAVVQGTRVADVPREELGEDEGARLITKWTANQDTFVFAMRGPARYLTPDPLSYAPDLRAEILPHALPSGEAFEFDAREIVALWVEQRVAPSPVWTPESKALTGPITFDERLQFLGYRIPQRDVPRDATLSLVLVWRVSGEIEPPLAAFVHLLDQEGHPLSQYDGWGTAIRGLEEEDIIVQHVRIPTPSDAAPGNYRLQLGVYSPNTMARWPVRGSDGKIMDRIWLPEVEIVE